MKEGGKKEEVLAALHGALEALKTNADPADEEEAIKGFRKPAESTNPKP